MAQVVDLHLECIIDCLSVAHLLRSWEGGLDSHCRRLACGRLDIDQIRDLSRVTPVFLPVTSWAVCSL